jgi:hypothetical protein
MRAKTERLHRGKYTASAPRFLCPIIAEPDNAATGTIGQVYKTGVACAAPDLKLET